MSKVVDFCHLHCHSEFSTLDGMPKVEEYVIKSHQLGMPALALTEHGNLRSMYQLQIKTQQGFDYQGVKYNAEKSVKPIFGVEFYVSFLDYRIKGVPESEKSKLRRDSDSEQTFKKKLKELEQTGGYRKRFHVLAFAKNQIGLQNLMKLNYLSWKDGYYYRPRIDSELLFAHSEGVIITTACVGGYAPEMVLAGKEDEADAWIKKAKKVFKDDFYIEIQPHNLLGDKGTKLEGKKIQQIANQYMIGFANRYNIKVIATNDCHYLNSDDVESHNVLLAINSRQTVTSEDAWRFGDTGFYLKTKDEMLESFLKNHGSYLSRNSILESLENTMEIVEKCDVLLEIDRKKGILPNVETKGYTDDEYLKRLSMNGWKNFRDMDKIIKEYANLHSITYEASRAVYLDRLKFELQRIADLKFAKYFLLIRDLINWARSVDIMVGPGRGSSSASLVCFLLGITSVDPLKYNLYFERFLAPGRIDYPDIDMDFEDSRRKEIFKYLVEKYGEENVCQIGTVGRMKGKQALQDVGRAFGVPLSETNKITKHIITRSSGDARASQSVEDSFKEFDVCIEYNKKYPDVLKHVKKLEGKARQTGIHAAGIQIAPYDIATIVPIEYRDTTSDGVKERIKVSGLDWLECQGLGLVKLDVLGLRTLTVLKSALKAIKVRHNIDLNLETVELEDKKVLQSFTDGNFVGIFQFDSIGMTKTCEKLTFKAFEDVIALNSLYRPGSMRSGLATHYINRAIGKEKIPSVHPIYDAICAETNGVLVYQEQLIKCFRDIAGYNEGTADELRKKIAKSAGVEIIGKESDKFIDGAVQNGMDRKAATQLFENMAFFGSYAFNKAHSAAYSTISYWGMYLKVYYPTEFYYALMKHEPDQNEILRFVVAARKDGVEVTTSDVNNSDIQFKILGDLKIISGMADIKGCGIKASGEIVLNQPYTSMSDMLSKVNRRQVHKGVIGALVKGNAFNSVYPSMGALLKEVNALNKVDKSTGEQVIKPVWEWLLELSEKNGEELYKLVDTTENELTEEQQVKIMSHVCPIPPFKHKIEYYENIDKYVFTDRVNRDLYISSDELYDHETEFGEAGLARTRGLFKGTLVDIKYNNVGDFHKDMPDDIEKKRIGWGKRYANVNIENTIGIKRINIDIDVFPTFRQVIDKGLQAPVLIIGNIMKWSEVIYADIIIDLDELKDKLAEDIPMKEKYLKMTPFERYLIKHPTSFHKDEAKFSINDVKYSRSDVIKQVCVLVTRVKNFWTKKGKKMAFVELEDYTGNLSTILWPEGVVRHNSKVVVGNVLKLYVKKNKDGFFIEQDRKIEVIKKYWKLEGHIEGQTSNKDIEEMTRTGSSKVSPTKYI